MPPHATPRRATFALVLALAPSLHGIDTPTLLADLDGDGRPERIEIAPAGSRPDVGEFHQLVVRDAGGAVLWQGPRTLSTDHPLAFGNWDFGFSLPQLAADFDRDGNVELVAPAPQSDVSPTCFRILRWQSGAFHPAWTAAFVAAPDAPDDFNRHPDPPPTGRWIAAFVRPTPGGLLLAKTVQYSGDAGASEGLAEMQWTGAGFRAVRWRTPMPPADTGPPRADTVRYRARLGPHDHANSRGNPLVTVAEILAQDRANVHRFNTRDPEDQPDPLFADPKARAWLARAPVTSPDPPGWESRIRRGTPVVEIETSAASARVRILAD